MKNIFVRQSYTNFKALFGMVFFICLCLVILIMIRNKCIPFGLAAFLVCMLAICIFVSKTLDHFGLYINGDDVYYKKFAKYTVDLNTIRAVKIIKAEIDGKFGRRLVRDVRGNIMYSMIFLSGVESSMYNYQQGDTMFIHEFRNYVLFYTIFDELALEYITALKKDITVMR